MTEKTVLKSKLVYSDDKKKRYLMNIEWDKSKKKAAVIMLSAGTATGISFDRTTNNVFENLYNLGFGSVDVVNLYAEIGCNSRFSSDSCEKNDGWHKDLKPGESYKTAMTVYGTVEGGEEAVKRLTDYKRADSKVHFENDIPPVCFNDYMNCCWAMPSYEKTIPLIDKAAELGAEVFCIDAGWQGTLFDNSLMRIGDWVVSKSKLSPKTFEKIVEYINSKGMKCGAWLEIEGVAEGTKGYAELDKYILKRRGHNIGNKVCFYDFRTEFIQNKIEKVFDMLYEMGVRYIKNDYNQSIGIGCGGVAKIDNLQKKLIKLARGGFKHHTTVANGHVKDILEEAFKYYLGYDVVSIDD